MFDIGFSELLVCALIALLVLGPERLPEAARTLGRWVGRARRFTSELSAEFERQLDAKELKQTLKEEGEKLGLSESGSPSLHAIMDARYEATPLVVPPDDFPESEEERALMTEASATIVPLPRSQETRPEESGAAASAAAPGSAPEVPPAKSQTS